MYLFCSIKKQRERAENVLFCFDVFIGFISISIFLLRQPIVFAAFRQNFRDYFNEREIKTFPCSFALRYDRNTIRTIFGVLGNSVSLWEEYKFDFRQLLFCDASFIIFNVNKTLSYISYKFHVQRFSSCFRHSMNAANCEVVQTKQLFMWMAACVDKFGEKINSVVNLASYSWPKSEIEKAGYFTTVSRNRIRKE